MLSDYSDFTIIIPTLNEGKNVGKVLSVIQRNYRGCNIFVVDDGSVDRTKEMVSKIALKNGHVKLFDRSAAGLRRGLTASIVYGILKSNSKYVIVIDADMQHPPDKIGEIAQRLNAGEDLVVANRARVTDWAAYRKIISRAFMYTGKIILFMGAKESCVDIFSGFFGVKRLVFVFTYQKNKYRFVEEGYKVLFDFLKCVDRGTLSISNVPFVFHSRQSGASKAGPMQGLALLKSFFS